MTQPITILGAGIAGLSASYHFGHERCVVFDQRPAYGGHTRSERFMASRSTRGRTSRLPSTLTSASCSSGRWAASCWNSTCGRETIFAARGSIIRRRSTCGRCPNRCGRGATRSLSRPPKRPTVRTGRRTMVRGSAKRSGRRSPRHFPRRTRGNIGRSMRCISVVIGLASGSIDRTARKWKPGCSMLRGRNCITFPESGIRCMAATNRFWRSSPAACGSRPSVRSHRSTSPSDGCGLPMVRSTISSGSCRRCR